MSATSDKQRRQEWQVKIEEWQKIGLKSISEYYLNEPMLTFQDVVTGQGHKTFAETPLELATEYAAADAHQTFQLMPILKKLLHEKKMEQLYEQLEFPLITVLYKMERTGIYLDPIILSTLNQKVTHDLNMLHMQILELIGPNYKTINLNSPKQLAQLLFEDLKLPPQKMWNQFFFVFFFLFLQKFGTGKREISEMGGPFRKWSGQTVSALGHIFL